ncbi:hypothetical protein EGH24_09605 [Halonotius terrestris]|uniref:Uncharacterized protein n=1 Tax=Halonotius terrestris TaxID=2487750 RepID=A0A8J8PAP1_9EURY|nr:hypothetical protein [Halonotius terrestris]TQQ79750.1 hypothetical protein EGH24_09605 [Halonotius terrestris]
MSATGDELAGVVDLFGALTREELSQALTELAFKQGSEVDDAAVTDAIESATSEYVLVEYDPEASDDASDASDEDTEPLLTIGPAAFPTLPPNAEDLPHILDYETRSVDRDRLAEQVRDRLQAEAEDAIAADDDSRAAELLDVSYDMEAWADIETDEIRASLTAALPQD